MEVLLIKDVPKVGRAGDIVRVADGFARNYLIPRGLGKPADVGVRKEAELLRQAKRKREQSELIQVQTLARRLDGLEITIVRRAGEQGKLYGSVTAADVAEAVAAQHGIHFDRRKVELEQPLKELGQHRVRVSLGHGAVATITVNVVQEG